MQERHLRRGLTPLRSTRFKNSIWRSENLTAADRPNLTPPVDGLGLCRGDWPIPTGFGRSIDAIDSLVEVLFSNSRNRYPCDQDFGIFVCSFRSRYQHVVVLLTASTSIKFEYPNFRLFPDF
jgi:hypothetical protein